MVLSEPQWFGEETKKALFLVLSLLTRQRTLVDAFTLISALILAAIVISDDDSSPPEPQMLCGGFCVLGSACVGQFTEHTHKNTVYKTQYRGHFSQTTNRTF